MDFLISSLTAYLPSDLDASALIRFLLVLTVGSLVLGLLGRIVFGKRSGLNHSISSAIGILFVYGITVGIYTFDPMNLSRFLSPLPFVSFEGEYLHIFSFTGADYPEICTQILNMIILAFLVNLLDSWLPRGKHIIGWYFYRLLTVILAMLAQLLVTGLLGRYLPGVLVTYAPIILLGILLVLALLSLLKLLLGLILTITNPILGAVYTFFFASKGGRMIGRAIVTTLILSILVYVLEYLNITVICVASSVLSECIPLIVALLIIWYLLGHLL